MKWRTDKTSLGILVFLTCLALVAMLMAERSVMPVRQRLYHEKLRAAKTMLLAMNAIKNARPSAALDKVNDPNATGMIGSEYTLITTDRGDLSSKLTTLNPNFAATVVEMLDKAKLKKGDTVALGVTGSFPALNIAVLAALESLDLKPLLISSVGSSSWGANDPELTWLDMERILNEKGILSTRSLAATIGGGKDIGRGLSPRGRELIRKAIRRNGLPLLKETLLEKDIQARLRLYEQAARGSEIRAYINVGGGIASLGSKVNGDLFPSGLCLDAGFHNFPSKGVMILMAERGLPVINLLKIPKVARHYKLPIDPVPLPEIGQGPAYFKERYDRVQLLLILLTLLTACFTVVRLNLSYYLAQLRQIRSRGLNPTTSLLPPIEPNSPKPSRRKT